MSNLKTGGVVVGAALVGAVAASVALAADQGDMSRADIAVAKVEMVLSV